MGGLTFVTIICLAGSGTAELDGLYPPTLEANDNLISKHL